LAAGSGKDPTSTRSDDGTENSFSVEVLSMLN
jgi:hypothetical protein